MDWPEPNEAYMKGRQAYYANSIIRSDAPQPEWDQWQHNPYGDDEIQNWIDWEDGYHDAIGEAA